MGTCLPSRRPHAPYWQVWLESRPSVGAHSSQVRCYAARVSICAYLGPEKCQRLLVGLKACASLCRTRSASQRVNCQPVKLCCSFGQVLQCDQHLIRKIGRWRGAVDETVREKRLTESHESSREAAGCRTLLLPIFEVCTLWLNACGRQSHHKSTHSLQACSLQLPINTKLACACRHDQSAHVLQFAKWHNSDTVGDQVAAAVVTAHVRW